MKLLKKMALEEVEKRVKHIAPHDFSDQKIADISFEIVKRGIADIYIAGFEAAIKLACKEADYLTTEGYLSKAIRDIAEKEV